MKIGFGILIFLNTFLSIGQINDTLNKFDLRGKKTGYWIIYLDERINPIDSANSYFKTYGLYEGGKKIFIHTHLKSRVSRKLLSNQPLPEKGHPIFINGTFKWLENDTLPIMEETYKEGFPEIYKAFYWKKLKNGKIVWTIKEIMDFEKRFNNILGTFYLEVYTNMDIFQGVPIKKYWYRNGKRGWRLYRIKEN